MSTALSFPATRGRMGARDFYMTVMTVQVASRFFQPTPAGLPPELRAQRSLNERRLPQLVDYLQERNSDWVFGSLTVSFDGKAEFDGKTLRLSADTNFVIVDGQHRLAALQEAIQRDPSLLSQEIGVMLIPFENLARNQQVFSDLNRTVQKTSRSLDILYNHSDPLNGLVLGVAQKVPLFDGRVEKNTNSVAVRSPRVITMSALYDSCSQLLGTRGSADALAGQEVANAAEQFCVMYWDYATELIKPWKMIRDGVIKPSEARASYVVTHAVAFYALGTAGRLVLNLDERQDWPAFAELAILEPLGRVDWRRTNSAWQGIVMQGDAVVTRRQTRQAMASMLCNIIDPQRFSGPTAVGDG